MNERLEKLFEQSGNNKKLRKMLIKISKMPEERQRLTMDLIDKMFEKALKGKEKNEK